MTDEEFYKLLDVPLLGFNANRKRLQQLYKENKNIRQKISEDGLTINFFNFENLKIFLPNRFYEEVLCRVSKFKTGENTEGAYIKEVNGCTMVYRPISKLMLSEYYKLFKTAKEQQIKKIEKILPKLKQFKQSVLECARYENMTFEAYLDKNPDYKKHIDVLNQLLPIYESYVKAKRTPVIDTLSPDFQHTSYGSKDSSGDRAPNSGLSVVFPDGTKFNERYATDTFQYVIEKIGIDRVRNCNIKMFNVPLISNKRDSLYGSTQRNLGHGWLLMEHGGVRDKVRILNQLNDKLDLGLIIEIIEP